MLPYDSHLPFGTVCTNGNASSNCRAPQAANRGIKSNNSQTAEDTWISKKYKKFCWPPKSIHQVGKLNAVHVRGITPGTIKREHYNVQELGSGSSEESKEDPLRFVRRESRMILDMLSPLYHCSAESTQRKTQGKEISQRLLSRKSRKS